MRVISKFMRKHPGITAAFPTAVVVYVLLSSVLRDILPSYIGPLVPSWDVFAIVFLTTAVIIVLRSGDGDIKTRAKLYDESDIFIVALWLSAASVSLIALMTLVIGVGGLAPGEMAIRLGLAITTVAFSWLVLHTVLAFHYAHVFYLPKRAAHNASESGGLQFPGDDPHPDYLDFVYFAFVIGATAQTSDVGITAKRMRRLATLHGTLSFAFNTVLLALAVSVAGDVLK